MAAAVVFSARPASAAQGMAYINAAVTGGRTTIYVAYGDEFVVHATGAAGYGYQGGTDCVGYPQTDPDGDRSVVVNGVTQACSKLYGSDTALPSAPVGELIGRIGNGPWFAVGSSYDGVAAQSGYLYLAYNDSIYSDNTGGYSTTEQDLDSTSGGGTGGGCGIPCPLTAGR